MSDMTLDVDVDIWTPYGWLIANNGVDYKVAGGTLENTTVTHKKQTVTSPYLEGTYVVSALRENVTETLVIDVMGSTHAAMMLALEDLKDALDQVSFDIRIRIEGITKTWHCYSSDYTITMGRELLHAKRAKLEAQIDREPAEEIEYL